MPLLQSCAQALILCLFALGSKWNPLQYLKATELVSGPLCPMTEDEISEMFRDCPNLLHIGAVNQGCHSFHYIFRPCTVYSTNCCLEFHNIETSQTDTPLHGNDNVLHAGEPL